MHQSILKYTILLFTIPLLVYSCKQREVTTQWSLYSPDSTLQVLINNSDAKKTVTYNIERIKNGEVNQVLGASPLGIIRSDGDFSTGLEYVEDESIVIRDSYTLISGKQLTNSTQANQLTLTFRTQAQQLLQIVFRAYDDGVSFRYVFPDTLKQTVAIQKELTGFQLAGEGRTWMQAYDEVTKWTPAYEKYYENGISIGTPSPNPSGWCFPALFQLNNLWVLLTEADLSSNYHGSHLNNADSTGLYMIEPPDQKEAYGVNDTISVTPPWSSPWRVIMVSNQLSGIIESNLVNHVSTAQQQGEFSWVKPGRASWSWWSESESPRDMNALKKYVDLSSTMGWEHSLIDANWNEMKNGNLQELASYANSKNVNLWAWYNSGGPHNEVTELPRDRMLEAEPRKKEMQWLQSIGVKGIKVDFFQSDKSFIIKQYHDILEDAATYQLMVNFHGCTIPRGWSRTWPNLLSMEAARGAETYRFAEDFSERAPLHNVHLVFTRNVIGSVDYTPVTFSNAKYPHRTTFAHELALSVVLESGIVHFADQAEAYLKLPSYCKTFLSTVPSIWNETRLLAGAPDADALVARRSSNTWYVGYINGLHQEKEVLLDFSFLPSGKYSWTLIGDGKSGQEFLYETKEITAAEQHQVNVLPFGGFVSIITPK